MGFLDSVACAFGGCPQAVDFHVSNVTNLLKAKMNVSCTSQSVATQTMTCGFQGAHCSHLDMTCSNTATLVSSCDLQHLVKAAADTLLQTESLDSLKKSMHLPDDASESDVTNEIFGQINSSCGSDTVVAQTVNSGVLCTYSDDIVLNVFNTMNLQSACATATVLGIATKSQAWASKSTQKIVFIVASVILLVYVIILGVIVIKIRASGRGL